MTGQDGTRPAPLRVGTSGWSYPAGRGTWNGVFYPTPGSPSVVGEPPTGSDFALTAPTPPRASRLASRARAFDELAYYAEHFDTVEVNSTFYRVPTPSVTASWARRTPPDFEFAVKLYQRFTHPSMFAEMSTEPASRPTAVDVDTFKRAIDPLASAGKLGPVLAQFPPSFRVSPESTEFLDWLLDVFEDYAIAVELRHRTWSDRTADTLDLLNRHEAAWVQIDEPKFRFSIRQNLLPNVRGFSYMRLHGRNADKWWHHDAAEDRYDYLYSAEELEPFVEAASVSRRLVKKLYLYMNNHFEAKAVANAVMLKHRLGEPVAGEYPQAFVERYPQVAGIVRLATSPRPSRTSS
jgi:uncharacterized protein YecE (DUF72 family)